MIGTVHEMSRGNLLKVIAYKGSKEVQVEFVSTGDKVYSPNNCLLVTKTLNSFFRQDFHGKRPGVTLSKSKDKWDSKISYRDSKGNPICRWLGSFNDEEEAYQVYIDAKQKELSRLLGSPECVNNLPIETVSILRCVNLYNYFDVKES